MGLDGVLSPRTRTVGGAMKQLVAALTLVFAVVVPRTAPAGQFWDAVKEEWGYRPWAVILAAPAFIVTAPFVLVKAWMAASEDDEDDYEDDGDDGD
jgi:ABC-type sulfate transport system permease component